MMNTLICFRFGANEHILRDCPKPYTAELMRAPKKGEGKRQKGKGTFWMDEQLVEEEIQITQEEEEVDSPGVVVADNTDVVEGKDNDYLDVG